MSESYDDRKYWKCRRKTECSARLVTFSTGRNVFIRSGGAPQSHSHAPNPEEVQALRLMGSVKRAAADHPERPPSAVMRMVQDAGPAVQAHLPSQECLRKNIRRERLRNMPSNPTTIEGLNEIPDQYRKTLVGDNFLLYDSYEDEVYEDWRLLMPCEHIFPTIL